MIMRSHSFAAARFTPLRVVARRLSLFALLCATLPAGAADYYWDATGTRAGTGGSGTWNTDDAVWRSGSGTGALGTWGDAQPAIDQANFADTAGTITLASFMATNANALRFRVGGYTLNSGYSFLFWASRLNLVGSNPTITTDTGTTTINAVLAGTAGMIKTGAGVLQLGGNNTYTGTTTVAAGTLRLLGSERLANTSLLNVAGGIFDLGTENETVSSVALTSGRISGTGVLTAGSFSVNAGDITAVLSGSSAGLVKVADGSATGGLVTLSGVNTYAGGTTVDYGTLRLNGSGRLADAGFLTVNDGIFDLNIGAANSDTVGTVTLAGGQIVGAGRLVGSSYDVRSGTVSARLGGTAALTKSTAGSVVLSGANTYSGATTINAGSLVLTGSLTGNGVAVTVNNGARFAGTGNTTRAVVVNNGGMLSPGVDSFGTLTTGAQIWNGGGIYDWNISSPAGAAGVDWDRLAITGDLTVNATTGNRFILNVTGSGALPFTALGNTVSWQIATYTGAFNGGFSPDEFTINLGGTWASLNSSYQFAIAQGADSHSLYLTMVVPEPKDYAMILGAITLGLVGYRRWRRRVCWT